jgi:DNA polymerase-3 subunit beta
LERSKLVTSATRGVRLEIAPGRLTVASDNPDLGDVVEVIETDYKGDSLRWAANPVYLLQLLAEIAGDSVTLSFKGELDPIMVRSTDDAAMRPLGEASLLGVIMPMRL